MFRLGRLAGLSAVVAAMLATVSLVDGSAAVNPDSCPTDKPLVVDASVNIKNTLDYGADGHVWALDAFTNSIQIWRLGGDAYCVKVHTVGTATTFGGLSPEGTGTVRAGVTASIDGTLYRRVYGRFAPTVPTIGLIGNYDAQCQQDGTCAAPLPGIGKLYFSSGFYHFDNGAYVFTADAGVCGTWFQSSEGDTGDIVC
jgi:hypothetical protein